MNFFIQNLALMWLIAGVGLTTLEAMIFPGIGFLFAGLGAITVGGMIAFGIIAVDNFSAQIIYFIISTSIWAGALWKHLIKKRETKNNYISIIGQTAIVTGNSMSKGKTGQVKWSGTIMNARIDDSCQSDIIELGTEVIIVNVQGNTLYIKNK